MLIQLLTIVITCVVHIADCKRKNPELLQAKIVNVRKHIFQCPRNSFVVGFNMNEERVHCRKFGEPAEKRNSKICKWCRKCYNSDGRNKENFRIARGLRFVFKKSRNFMAKKQVKQVQLYCCKQDCQSFDCKVKQFHKPVIDTHLKKINFINYAIYEKWENVLKAEFCRPKCLSMTTNDTDTGEDLDGNGGEETDLKGLERAKSYCQLNYENHLGCFCGNDSSLCPNSHCQEFFCVSHLSCSPENDSCERPTRCDTYSHTCRCTAAGLEVSKEKNTCCYGVAAAAGNKPDVVDICRNTGKCSNDLDCLRWASAFVCDVCFDGRCVKNMGGSCSSK